MKQRRFTGIGKKIFVLFFRFAKTRNIEGKKKAVGFLPKKNGL